MFKNYKRPYRQRPDSYEKIPKKITKQTAKNLGIVLKKHPKFLTTLNFGIRREKYLLKLQEKYGNTVGFYLHGKLVYLLNTPEDVHLVLTSPKNAMIKGYGFNRLRIGLGEGLLTSEEPIHLNHKRLISPLFHKENIQQYINRIYNIIELETSNIPEKTNPVYFSTELSLKVITELLLGKPESKEIGKITTATLKCMEEISAVVPNWKKYRKYTQNLKQYTAELLENQKWDKKELTILQELTELEDGNGNKLGTDELQDEILTLLVAGHETGATILAAALVMLSRHKESYEKLVKEAIHANWISENRTPTIEEVLQETYCNQVINETLRTHSPAWFMPRICMRDYNFTHFTAKKGTQIFISPYVSHRNIEYFPNPSQWDPERWEPGFKQTLPKGVYYPFGGGSRMCIGEHLSLVTLKISLLKIVNKYYLDLEDKEKKIKTKALVTYHISDTSKIIFTKK